MRCNSPAACAIADAGQAHALLVAFKQDACNYGSSIEQFGQRHANQMDARVADSRAHFKTRSLTEIVKNKAPTQSSRMPVGASAVGTASKDLSFVLSNFKEIEKVCHVHSACFLFPFRFDHRMCAAVVWSYQKSPVQHRGIGKLCIILQV
jgi:hypothetical protein